MQALVEAVVLIMLEDRLWGKYGEWKVSEESMKSSLMKRAEM